VRKQDELMPRRCQRRLRRQPKINARGIHSRLQFEFLKINGFHLLFAVLEIIPVYA
jgi:hypothetical protein